MLLLLLKFFVLGAVIVVAGTFLARYGDVIAEKTGLGRTLVGLILLAGATSLPELAVDCVAVLMKPPAPDLAVSAIVGSSLFNLFILGVVEFLHGSSHRILSPASIEHGLSAIASIALTGLIAIFVLIDLPLAAGPVGGGTVVIFVAYLFFLRLIYLDQQERQTPEQETEEATSITLRTALQAYGILTMIIFAAAYFLTPTAEQIAKRSGLGDSFVGATFLAITTSLPELVTTLAAVRMGAFDMAVGNIFGSNAFNASILLPVDVLYPGKALLNDVATVHAITAGMVILVNCVALAAMLYRPRKRYAMIDPDATLIVMLCCLAMYMVYVLSPK
jgi:cation:H+ antiporter